MPVEIDGYAVLAAIGRGSDAFPAVKADVVKVAKTLVGKQLKDKTLTLDQVRAVAVAIGLEAFDLLADGMSDAEIKSLLSRLDKHSPALKTGGPEQRKRLAELAKRLADPVAKEASAPTKPSIRGAAKPKVERSGNSRAMSARKKV